MIRTSVSFFCFVFLLALAIEGCSKATRNPEMTTLVGTLRVVGNEPFTHLVLTVGENPERAPDFRNYLITGPLEKELREKYQYRKVTLEGYMCIPPKPQFKHCFNPVRIMQVEGK